VGFALAACSAEPDGDAVPVERAAPAERPDVIVITLDTLRADHLSFYGYEAETAPFLAKLARHGAVFERAFATSTWTAPTTASIFTGLYPTQHGVTTGFFAQRDRIEEVERSGSATLSMKRIARNLSTLPERFREAGYTTFGVAANVNVGPELGFNEGFDHFERLHGMKIMESGTAEQVVQQLESWTPQLRAGGPNFVYLHFNDVHWPYIGRKPWYADLLVEFGDQKRAAYDSQIAYVDHALERVFKRFRWRRNAIVVVVADHGEELGDHGHTGHGMFMYRELLQALWLVHAPAAGVSAQVIESNVSQIDLLPTLLELAGLAPGSELPGRSLRPLLLQPEGAAERSALEEELKSRALFAHRFKPRKVRGRDLWAVVQGRWKLIDNLGSLELYDTLADPDEKRDLAGEQSEVVERLQLELSAFRDAASWGEGESAAVEVDEASIEALRELGYVE
jgi:arylsulfatase A-like enzyme